MIHFTLQAEPSEGTASNSFNHVWLISYIIFPSRVVIWNDSNGSAWVLSHIGWETLNTHELEVEDCTVIYSRASWHHWSGGNIFNMRGEGAGDGGYSLIFRNIKVEDPRPTLQPFKILMEGKYVSCLFTFQLADCLLI